MHLYSMSTSKGKDMYDDGGGKTRKKKMLKYSFSMVNLPNIQKRVWLNILLQKDI